MKIFASVFFLLIFTSSAFSQTEELEVLTPVTGSVVEIYPFTDDLFLKNTSSIYNFYLETLTDAYSVNRVAIEIRFQNSITAMPNLSFINITLNGNDLSTRFLDSPQPEEKVWFIEVPVGYIKNGYNTFAFTCLLRSNDDPCYDLYNSFDYVKLFKESRILVTRTISTPLKLMNFPFPYVDNLVNAPLKSVFRLSDSKNPEIVDAFLKLVSSLSSFTDFSKQVRFQIADLSSETQNTINIGFKNSYPELENINAGQEEGIIYHTGQGETLNNLYVSGNDGPGLLKSVYALSNKVTIETLNQNPAVISEMTNVNNHVLPVVPANQTRVRFADLGIDDVNLNGIYEQRKGVTIVKPVGADVGIGSYLYLKFVNSANLREQTSSLTVLINGRFCASIRLNRTHLDSVKVFIPEQELRKNLWQIEFVAYNDILLQNSDCNKRYYEEAWTNISSESEIEILNGNINYIPTLEGFPMVTNSLNRSSANVVVWLKENFSYGHLEIAATSLYQATRRSGVPLNIVSIIADEVTQEIRDADIVIKVSEDGISGNADLAKKMFVDIGSDGRVLTDLDFEIPVKNIENTAIIQALESPWNSNGVIYSIVQNGASTDEVINVINSDSENSLSGKVVLINDGIKVIGLSGPALYTPLAESFNFIFDNLRWIIFILFVSLVILIWFYRKVRNKNKK